MKKSTRPKALWTRCRFTGARRRTKAVRPERIHRRRYIAPRSKAMIKRGYAYLLAVELWKWKPENERCRFPGCGKPMEDCHHIRGKLGPLLMDQRFWTPVCRFHHWWIGAHPAVARALGLLPPAGEWNTLPKVIA
jgi:hypothetical protein